MPDETSPLSPAFLKTRLYTALYPPSTSTQHTLPNPVTVFAAVTPLLNDAHHHLLDPYLQEIALLVNQYPASTDEEHDSALRALAICWRRAVRASPPSRSGKSKEKLKEDAIAGIYAGYARNAGRDEAALRSIETSLQNASRPPMALVAAWSLLQVRLGRWTAPPLDDPLPPVAHVVKYLERTGEPPLDPETRQNLESLYAKVGSGSLPASVDILATRLSNLRARHDDASIISLWNTLKSGFDTPVGDTEVILSHKNRILLLSKFIYFCSSAGYGPTQARPSALLVNCAKDAMSLVPRPIPLIIHHTLISLSAKLDENPLVSLNEVKSLDNDSVVEKGSTRDKRLEKLNEAWKAACKDGIAKDLKLYHLYMEGLGRLGELQGVQVAWNMLIHDTACRDLYLASEEGKGEYPVPDRWSRRILLTGNVGKTVFPPTSALNHLISSLLLIPGSGPSVALQLFDQACQPTSTIPCDLITINTILRHYARAADINSMNRLFQLAGTLGLHPDIVTYTTFVQGLLRGHQIDMAKAALQAMEAQGIRPNERLFSLLISDLAKAGHRTGMKNAEEMMDEMKKQGLKPSVVTWTGLVSGYFKGGWEEDGWRAVKRMRDQGLELNHIGWNMIFRQTSRGQARLLRRMIHDKVQPNGDTWIILLAGIVKNQQWEEGEQVVAEMRRSGWEVKKDRTLEAMVRRVESRR
ncbi:hypothetical protein P7C73_g5194, partial [Tremellales sp. Uapishka_1]